MTQFYDKNGVPVCPGDLIRTFHYTGARRKKHYLYHVAVSEGSDLLMVPTCFLEPTMRNEGGDYLPKYGGMDPTSEVIHGYGPGDVLSFEDRPKRKEANDRH
jgi:hypothetical protein